MPETKTVLFVQRFPDGGSITSLLDLVRGLDPARYRAVVAFANPNVFLDEFTAAGATVDVFRNEPPHAARPRGRRTRSTPPSTTTWWAGTRRVVRRAVRYDVPSALHLWRLSRRSGVDIVHGNNDVSINRDAALVATVGRRPLVCHVRGFYEPPTSVELWVDRRAARRVARLFFISEAVAGWHAPLRIPAARTEVIDNPFDVAGLRVPPDAAVAASLGLEDGDRMVLHVARITPMKGQDVLLRALPALLEQDPKVRVVLLGAATDAQGEVYEAKLRSLAAQLGVKERVLFAGSRRDVAEVLALAEVAVHSATEPEPFGRVIVEAMAAARPIVASDAGGVPEIIDDGVTGVLVPLSDPVALAAAVGRLLGDPAEAEAMGRRAASAVDERFGLHRHAERIQAAYDEVLARR